MHVQCLLWDFGDTLCDELSLWMARPFLKAVAKHTDLADVNECFPFPVLTTPASAQHSCEHYGI
jgi:hypothetical protein